MDAGFAGKLGLQQRVLPAYRVPFIEELERHFTERLSIFSGEARQVESIKTGCPGTSGILHQNAKNVHIGSGPLYFCWQRGLIDWLENWQPDALVVEANPRYFSTPAAIRWMHQRNRPVLGWGLGASPLSGPVGVLRSTQRRKLLNTLDGIIAYSEQGAAEYRHFGFPAERVFTAHNAAVLPPEAAVHRDPYQSKATILFVGRLQRRKRLEMLFQACASVPLHLQPDVIIAGDGPDRQYFESFAKEIYPDAQFVGAKFGDDLTPCYLKADLFVLPGTGGLAVQQAMAQALPVIVAEGDGTQNDLVRPSNGWLIKPGNPGSLVETLAAALANPEKLTAMGQESFRIVKEEINLKKMAQAFTSAVQSIHTMGLRKKP